MIDFDATGYVRDISPEQHELPRYADMLGGLYGAYPGAVSLVISIADALGISRETLAVHEPSQRNRLKIDIPVTDRCNLGCASCSHFAPLAHDAPFIPVSEIAESLKLLREAFPGNAEQSIEDMFILGGEPLMHPELPDIIREAGNAFGNSNKYLVTNMLLMEEKFGTIRDAMRDTGTFVGFSCYGTVNESQVSKGLSLCWSADIVCIRFGEYPANFDSYPKSVESRFPATGKSICRMNTCVTLRGPYLYLCSPVTYLEYPNRAFGLSLHSGEFDRIDLRKLEHPDEALVLSILPHPFCRHCDTGNNRKIGWKPSRKLREEWFVD